MEVIHWVCHGCSVALCWRSKGFDLGPGRDWFSTCRLFLRFSRKHAVVPILQRGHGIPLENQGVNFIPTAGLLPCGGKGCRIVGQAGE